jgi:hypothetical protein
MSDPLVREREDAVVAALAEYPGGLGNASAIVAVAGLGYTLGHLAVRAAVGNGRILKSGTAARPLFTVATPPAGQETEDEGCTAAEVRL